jgi:SET domain-containing protein
MFRIDNERVIDATRTGSIAHLINHSCEPNCYSRVISVNGDEHIIIFAKRDVAKWEELTYDYRFIFVPFSSRVTLKFHYYLILYL